MKGAFLLCALTAVILGSCGSLPRETAPIEQLPDGIVQSPAFRQLLSRLRQVDEESCSMWVYTLHEGSTIVAVYADAMGTLYYTADCYELTGNSYRKLSRITYSSRSDFSEPALRNGIYTVTSRKSGDTITFPIHRGGIFTE